MSAKCGLLLLSGLLLIQLMTAQESSCPLAFPSQDLSLSATKCRFGVPWSGCCRQLELVLGKARANYSRISDELFLPVDNATACLGTLGRELDAREVPTKGSVLLEQCFITANNLTASTYSLCAAYNSDKYTRANQFRSLFLTSHKEVVDTCLSTISNGCSPCVSTLERALSSFVRPGYSPWNQQACDQLGRIATVAAIDSPTAMATTAQCLWNDNSPQACTGLDYTIIDYTPIVKACKSTNSSLSVHCCTLVCGNGGVAYAAGAQKARDVLPGAGQEEACANSFIKQLSMRGLNGESLLDCGQCPAENNSPVFSSCLNTSDPAAFQQATDDFAVFRTKCAPGSCSPNCHTATIAEGARLAGLEGLPQTKRERDRVVACLQKSTVAFGALLGPEYFAETLNCYLEIPDEIRMLVNSTARSVASGQSEPASKDRNKLVLILVLVAAAALVPLAITGFVVLCLRKRRQARAAEDKGKPSELPVFVLNSSTSSTGGGPVWFTYKQLEAATNGFAESSLLGQGGSGRVYKGVLPNGVRVAIKDMKGATARSEQEFSTEAAVIGSLRHSNLLRLVGWHAAGKKRILVFDYLSQGSLDDHLYPKNPALPKMDWPMRLKVAIGVAKALVYLHEDCTPRNVHRDIKPSNVLLDDKYEARVSDFGLAKLTQDGATHVTTAVYRTCQGYLAPEYVATGQLNEKSDVYSFGVLLLELLAGRKPMDPTASPDEVFLVEWAWGLIGEGRDLDVVSEAFGQPEDLDEHRRALHVALLCSHTMPQERPTMGEALAILVQQHDVPELPPRPVTFFTVATRSFRQTLSETLASNHSTRASEVSGQASHALQTRPLIPAASGTVGVPQASTRRLRAVD